MTALDYESGAQIWRLDAVKAVRQIGFDGPFSPTLRFALVTRRSVRMNIKRAIVLFPASTMRNAAHLIAATLLLALERLMGRKTAIKTR